MPSIEINDTQAVRELLIDMPDNDGGVVVIRGENATGKSTALKIISSLIRGDGKFHPTDGQKKGVVEGLGKKITVGGTTRHSGELEVPSIEGKLEFSDLVRPQAKDPDVRDKIRIKALLTLSGVEADPKVFYDALGGKDALESVVPPDALKSSDIVEMANKIRLGIHARAKHIESDADREEGYAKSCRDAAGEFVEEKIPDLKELHAKAFAAEIESAKIQERYSAFQASTESREKAKAELESAIASYRGLSHEQAAAKASEAKEKHDAAAKILEELEKQLVKQREVVRDLGHALSLANAETSLASTHEKRIKTLEVAISGGVAEVEGPSELDVEIAKQEAAEARRSVEKASAMIAAIEKGKQAKVHIKEANRLRERAESLRDAAKSIDKCLSSVLPAGQLKAKDGRLVADTKRGKDTLYDECSNGERWSIALPYGIQSVGAGGVIPVIQDAWQDLDDKGRAAVAEMCKQAKVWIVTAEVADGELRAERY